LRDSQSVSYLSIMCGVLSLVVVEQIKQGEKPKNNWIIF
jgi:hypothetical protein